MVQISCTVVVGVGALFTGNRTVDNLVLSVLSLVVLVGLVRRNEHRQASSRSLKLTCRRTQIQLHVRPQGGELIHAKFNTLYRVHGNIPNTVDRLRTVTKQYL